MSFSGEFNGAALNAVSFVGEIPSAAATFAAAAGAATLASSYAHTAAGTVGITFAVTTAASTLASTYTRTLATPASFGFTVTTGPATLASSYAYTTAGSGFVPTSLPGYLGYWGSGGRYSDTAATIPSTVSGGVKAWKDVLTTGTALKLTQSTGPPTLNASGGIVFGTDQRLILPAGLWAQVKTIVWATGSPTGGTFVFMIGSSHDDSSGGRAINFGSGNIGFYNTAGGGGHVTYSDDNASLGTSVRCWAGVFSSTVDRIYDLTVETPYVTGPGAFATAPAPDVAAIGTWAAGLGTYDGPFYSLYLDSNELSASEIRSVIGYMRADWIAAHPIPKKILLHGNSLFAGTANPTEADRFYFKLQAALPSATVVNLGTGGITTPNLTTGAHGVRLEPAHTWDVRCKNVLVMIEVTNDHNNSGQTAAQCIQHYQDYFTLAASYGVWDDIVACTVPKNLGNETDRSTINAAIRANYLSWGATKLLDFGAMAHIGTGDSTSDPTYWADSVHPAAPGNQIMVDGDGVTPGAAFVLGDNAIGALTATTGPATLASSLTAAAPAAPTTATFSVAVNTAASTLASTYGFVPRPAATTFAATTAASTLVSSWSAAGLVLPAAFSLATTLGPATAAFGFRFRTTHRPRHTRFRSTARAR